MRRVLVVHHDIDLADQEADSLRRQGYEVEQCSGPGSYSCPVMRGEPCPAAHRADVLVYDVWASGEAGGAQRLIEGLRELHPEIPVVLTAPGMELDWVETTGPHRVVPLVGVPTGERLRDAIEEALAPGIATARATTSVGPSA
jgi:DNA-binding NtrC family response regulator